MTIVDVPCTSWLDAKGRAIQKLYGSGTFVRGRFYFRGQSSDAYGLQSSFDRWYASAGLSMSKPVAEKRLIALFAEERLLSLPPQARSESEEEALALAQHYGVPTRLLDWSESPYVAAFFAFASLRATPEPDSNVAIWCLDTTNSLWSADKGIRLVDIPSPYNDRLKNQLGKFTLLQSPFDTVEEHVQHCKPTGTVIWKITVPSSEARVALSDLDFMGINYSSIYPGVDGCARAATLRILLEQRNRTPKPLTTAKRRTKPRPRKASPPPGS